MDEVTRDPLGAIWIQPKAYRDVTAGTLFDTERKLPTGVYRRQCATISCYTTDTSRYISVMPPTSKKKKNPAAVALGKLGASKGGKARARKLSAKRRKEIARNAIEARWKKYRAEK